ncbi:hypothetical protein [Pseudoalteromonas sp.]|uniref:hypothetical protein n=1 Tax=Pseudoalteromonas sp. TaxID=53249 RepID=UPI00272C48A3|nr:hypothetical protein [Pseudoalteromonas sp.]
MSLATVITILVLSALFFVLAYLSQVFSSKSWVNPFEPQVASSLALSTIFGAGIISLIMCSFTLYVEYLL